MIATAVRREATNRPGSTSQGACLVLPQPAAELDGSGRRPHLQLVGQLADLRRRIAAMATKGLEKRQLTLLGPARHGLGRHMEDVGHLRGMEIAGKVRCGLAAGLGCHGASLSCGGPGCGIGPGSEWAFVRPRQQRPEAATMLAITCCVQDKQDDHADRPNCLPQSNWAVSAHLLRSQCSGSDGS